MFVDRHELYNCCWNGDIGFNKMICVYVKRRPTPTHRCF